MKRNMKTIIAALTASFLAVPLSAVTSENLPLTKEQQAQLTPDAVLKDLMAGNKRFVAGQLSEPNASERVKAAKAGQYPKAFILSCIDSRVPVEQVFDQRLGDIFVGRVAGNVENPDQLGSMEFATKVAGVKLVMVLGHEACGAVKGACDHVELGNITSLLENIKPAVEEVSAKSEGDKSSKNKDFVAKVVETNVHHTLADIRKRSEILRQLEKDGKIKIVGAVYSLHDGKVTLLDS